MTKRSRDGFTIAGDVAAKRRAFLAEVARAGDLVSAAQLRQWETFAAGAGARELDRMAREKDTIALTQQDVLNAYRATGEASPSVWLRAAGMDSGEVELIDYTLTPVGHEPDEGQAVTLLRPLVLSRAESGSIWPGLPLRAPLWVIGAEAERYLAPGPRLTLVVRWGYGPTTDPPRAVRAAEQIRGVTPDALAPMCFGNQGGEIGGEPWVWVPQPGTLGMPLLYVLIQHYGSPGPARKWLELYARLLLGEE